MAGLAVKILRPAGEGRKVVKYSEESDQIIKAAREGDIDTLVSMSHRGIDVTTARGAFNDTVLHTACGYGQATAVAVILTSKISVNVRNDAQKTPMHDAANSGKVEIIKMLKDNGAAVDAKTTGGRTPLHDAAYNGCSRAVETLIDIGATVDIVDNNQLTPMHKAAVNGKVEIIKMLKDNGAAVDAKDVGGDTPLHYAAYNGHNSAVETLVNLGATVDIKNNIGNTPLADAVEKGRGDVVKYLVDKHKADTAKVPQNLQQRMKKLLGQEAELAADNKDTSTHDSQQDHHGKLQSPKRSVNKKTVLAYHHAFKKGKKAANKFKIVVIGPEGAGKTSTVYSLLNKAFQDDQPSTVGADVNTCTAVRFFTATWKQVEIQHQLANLPKQLRRNLKSCMLNLPEETSELTPTKPTISTKSQKLPQDLFQAEEIPHEVAAKVQEVVDAEEIQDDEIQITILDLGGQEVYYHIHFLFLAREDIIFIAFDASKDLDEPVVCRQRLTRFQRKVKARGMQTNLETIETLMQSVYSHCGEAVDGGIYISNRTPTIMLIATHSQHLLSHEKAAIVFKIYEKFDGKPFMDHLPRSTKHAVFFVDNSARDPQVFDALKAVALSAAAPSIAKECPISYLQFEVEILKESQSKTVISKQEAFAIAEKTGLQDTLMEVLHYHTLKGVLLYYPDVETLQDKVFISPQEVSDLVSSVISTHNCEPSSAKLQQVCHRYDQFGLLEEDLLDDMLHSVNRYDDKNTILGFLENFFLAVEVLRGTKFDEEKHSYTTPKSGKVFLIPSMLVYNSKVVPTVRKGDIILMYHFPDLFLPEHVFNEVLVKMVSWCNQHDHHVHSIFHGVGCFQFKGRMQSFKLHHCLNSCSIKCFITVHQCNLTNNALDVMLLQRQHLRDHLEGCIKVAHQSHIPCARPPIGYLDCPLHSSEENVSPHIQLDQLTQSGDIICPKSIDCLVIPKEAYALLFVASLTNANQIRAPDCTKNEMKSSRSMLSQNVPTMKELSVKVIPKVAADWKQLAFILEFDIPRVNIIKQKGRDDPESCCCELLCEWLDSDHGIKPKNWTTLLTALKQIKKLTSVTDEIEKDLTAQWQLTISQNEPDSNTTSSAHTSKVLSQAPLMHQVVKVVVPRIAGHWKAVAYNLHYDVTRVRIIQEQCRDDPEQCSWELFMYWLQSSEGLGPRSWETLLSALKQAPNLKSVSESIEKELMELLKSSD